MVRCRLNFATTSPVVTRPASFTSPIFRMIICWRSSCVFGLGIAHRRIHQLMHEVFVAVNDASRITHFLQVGQLVPGAADFAGDHPDRRNNQFSQNLRI